MQSSHSTTQVEQPSGCLLGLARDFFVSALTSEGLRLKNFDDVKYMARQSVVAARALRAELAGTDLETDPGPGTGPTAVPHDATNQQKWEEQEVAAILEEDIAKTKPMELGSVREEDDPLGFEGPRCPFCGCTSLLHDGSLSERVPGRREAHEYVTCSACRAQGPAVLYTPYVDSQRAEEEAVRLWKLGIPRGSVAAWSIGQTSPTPYLTKVMDEIAENSPVEEVVIMPAAAQGKSETGSIVDEDDPRAVAEGRQMPTESFDEWIGVTGALPEGTGWYHECRGIVEDADERIATLLELVEIGAQRHAELEGQRVSAVRRADSVSAERDALRRDFYEFKTQAAAAPKGTEVESIAGEVQCRTMPAPAVGSQMRSMHTGAVGRVIRVGGRAITLQFGDIESYERFAPDELECVPSSETEAGSVSEDQLANLEKCRPEGRVDVGDRVVLGDGRAGTVVGEHRQFDVEIDGNGQIHFLNDDFVHAMGESADTTDAGSIKEGGKS